MWLSGRLCCAGLMAGLVDLNCFFQHKGFYDSIARLKGDNFFFRILLENHQYPNLSIKHRKKEKNFCTYKITLLQA